MKWQKNSILRAGEKKERERESVCVCVCVHEYVCVCVSGCLWRALRPPKTPGCHPLVLNTVLCTPEFIILRREAETIGCVAVEANKQRFKDVEIPLTTRLVHDLLSTRWRRMGAHASVKEKGQRTRAHACVRVVMVAD